MSEPALADAAARLAASDPARSVLLEAPAGSGKTAVLTQRFLRLLCTVEEPGQVLAITFTKKAAAEMLGRISRALRGEFTPGDPNAPVLKPLAEAALAHGAARGWHLEEGAQALRIQTIDAFNYWLASELPVASRSGTELTVTEAPAPLYQRAARRTLLAAEAEADLRADGALLFERLDNHWLNLEREIAGMLAERGHWLGFVIEEDPRALCARVDASLKDLARAGFAQAHAHLPEALRRRAERLPGVGSLSADADSAPAWHGLLQLCFTQGGEWRRRVTTQLGAGFADRERVRELTDLIADLAGTAGLAAALLALRRLPPAQLSPEDAAAVGALARLLRRAAIELQAEFAAAGRVDYTYLTGAARQALTEAGEPTDLALRTGLSLRHVLVDEFQDTSLAQVQLLAQLTAAWEPGDGRTLFVVGDPMQSIYRFRDAEVGLFLRARDFGIGALRLEPLKLRRNFRTVPALVSFANALFGTVFPPADDLRAGAVRFTASLAALPERAPPAGIAPVSCLLFEERAAEARALAARIAALRAAEPGSSIGVLVTAHAHAVLLTEAIERAGIPVRGVDLVPLGDRPVVRDLVALGRALTDLSDRTAWLTVLRAPWSGVTLATLTALSGLINERQLVYQALGDEKRLRGLEAGDRARLARVHGVATRALAALGTRPLADLLESAWIELGAPDAYAAHELADARAFLAALAERTAAFEWRGSMDFATLADGLFSTPQGGGDHPVQVMTVHRAKGLEFDHVLLPALERGHRGGERRLLAWADLPSEASESELIIAPAPAVGTPDGALQRYLKDLFRSRDLHERQRLLYVAVTRARRTLWLSGVLPRTPGAAPRPRAHTPLHALWPALEERFEYPPAEPVVAARRTHALTRLTTGWQPAATGAGVALAHLPGAHLSSGAPVEFSWVGETQRHIGTVVHAHLAQLAQQPGLPDPASALPGREAIGRELARLGTPERELPGAVARVTEALANTLADPRGRWLLDARHREAASELALTGVVAGTLRNVVIDRAFVDATGTRWVVDFKTSRHEGGGLEAFLDAELERYRGQLELYATLARGLGAEPVRAALYFPLLRAFRELP